MKMKIGSSTSWFKRMQNIAITKHEHLIHDNSRRGRPPNLFRDWQFGHDRIYDHYFFGNPMYDGK
jgi:hypothetical protein